MNMEQIQTEIRKLQEEYNANPTPENLKKMQSGMMELQSQMMTASLQGATAALADTYGPGSEYASAAIAGAKAGAAAYSQAFGDLFGDGEDDAEELSAFLDQHPVAEDKKKYLPIGALLLCVNDEPYMALAMRGDKGDWAETLKESWGIENAQDGKEMLEALLKGRHESTFGEDYRKLKDGQPHDLDDDSVEAYQDVLEALEEELPELLPFAKDCRRLLAWDLERAGFLARIFTHLGWLAEAEAWDWISKTAIRVKAEFSCWEAYLASVLTGRAMAIGFNYGIVGAICELTEDDFLKSHPISAF
ncbi:MAG: DUF1266 domain-containing protein [Candidatus Methanoplasma sp.]|jgi:hypothetical protein|nr:DUF1266 domain-containing protein [Candidatus Methanoplasma sp.]